MTDAVRLAGVHRWAGEGDSRVTILSDIHLTVATGDYVALMGASGSGKSTLLNIMGLLDLPNSGSVTLLGRDVTTLRDDDAAHLRATSIGFIFQAFHLLNYLTVRENIALPLSYAGRQDPDAVTPGLLERMRLSHRADAYPATLSGGERQRAAIARAVANRPSLILADEPTGALDSKNGSTVLEMIGELHRAGATVILVTHDEKVARRARRIVHLQDGRIV